MRRLSAEISSTPPATWFLKYQTQPKLLANSKERSYTQLDSKKQAIAF